MMRKSFLVIFVAFFLTLGLGFFHSGWSKTYKLGHVFGTSNANHLAAEIWAEMIGKYTNGKIKVRVFPAGQLGGDRELGQSLQNGTLELSVLNPGSCSGFDQRLSLGALPFLSPTYEDVDRYVLRGWVAEEMNKYGRENGWITLAWGENDFRHITNSKRPVKTVEDIKGLKIRVPEVPLMLKIWDALGAVVTPIAYPELFTALQQKTVDGQENGVLLTYSSRLYEAQKYFTFIGYMYSGTAFCASGKLFKDLDRETQYAIEKAAWEAACWQVKRNRRDIEGAMAAMKEAGIEFYQMPPEELAKLRKIAIGTWEFMKKHYTDDVWKKLMDLQK